MVLIRTLVLGVVLATVTSACALVDIISVGHAVYRVAKETLDRRAREASNYPKASPDATVLVHLLSNENCEFLVDGQSVISGKAVKILVTPREHRVVCKPENYPAEEKHIVPPFDPNIPIRFTFLIGDEVDAESK